MQTVSSTYKQVFRQPGHVTEVKAELDGSSFGMASIYSVRQQLRLFSGSVPEIGNCCSSTLELSVIHNGPFPRMGEIELSTRLLSFDLTESSEWIPAGTFYADTKNRDQDGEHLKITAFDAMMKADQPYLENATISSWPADEADVVDDIADLMGVTVDSRTVLAGYEVPLPNQDWTAREVLGWIAAANGGNWIITPNNELLLIKLEGITSLLGTDTSHAILMGDSLIVLSTGIKYEDTRDLLSEDEDTAIKFGNDFVVMNGRGRYGGHANSNDGQNIQKNARNMQNLGLLQPFTGVKLWWSRETSYEDQEVEVEGETTTERVAVEQAYFAGDDTGRVLEADCPWATQAMADAILTQIEGYVWQGAVVEGAEITPAAELGDAVICDGVVFPLCSLDVTYDGAYAPTISAPADEEVDYEYHYESETQRQLNRKATLGENYYGFRVTRENGIEVVNIVDGTETTRMILNSNVQAFYNADGIAALYFDPVAGKYKFRGDVVITNGSLALSSAFAIFSADVTEEEAEAETVPDGFNLYSKYNGRLYDFLQIYQNYEYTVFTSPGGGYARFDFSNTYFTGNCYYNNSEIVTKADIRPTVTSPPANQTVTAGSTAYFSVSADNATSYQWYYCTPGSSSWTAVSAASGRTSSYSLTALARHDGYQYYCKVTNAAGSVASPVATLTVESSS